MKRDVVYLALVLFALALSISCSSEQAAEVDSAVKSEIEFNALDLDGNLHHSTEWIGKQPVVINLWGTWCPPCRREIPDLAKLYKEYKPRGIEMIGIALERNKGPQDVKKFADQYKMEWVMLMGDMEIAIKFDARAVPKTIFVDRHGKVMPVTDYTGRVVREIVGPQPLAVFRAAFEKLLEE